MHHSKIKKALVLVFLSSSAALGCELIVDFDRTRIPGEETPDAAAGDATVSDTGAPDTGTDGQTPPGDGGTDAADDGATDGGSDAADAGDDADAA